MYHSLVRVGRVSRPRSIITLVCVFLGLLTAWLPTSFTQSIDAASAQEIIPITGGEDHTCAISSSGGAKCWGYGGEGQLGNGDARSQYRPVNVLELASGVRAISAGMRHTCALTSVGGVKCWGSNSNGNIGDGTNIQRNVPVNVNDLTSGVTAIAMGGYHGCALTAIGGVKCWGYNDGGQLGDGTTTSNSTPVDVKGLTQGVRAIVSGFLHSCALTVTGAVQCWGYNSNGQLGNGTTNQSTVPVTVNGLSTGISKIYSSAGASSTCALMNTGGVK